MCQAFHMHRIRFLFIGTHCKINKMEYMAPGRSYIYNKQQEHVGYVPMQKQAVNVILKVRKTRPMKMMRV